MELHNSLTWQIYFMSLFRAVQGRSEVRTTKNRTKRVENTRGRRGTTESLPKSQHSVFSRSETLSKSFFLSFGLFFQVGDLFFDKSSQLFIRSGCLPTFRKSFLFFSSSLRSTFRIYDDIRKLRPGEFKLNITCAAASCNFRPKRGRTTGPKRFALISLAIKEICYTSREYWSAHADSPFSKSHHGHNLKYLFGGGGVFAKRSRRGTKFFEKFTKSRSAGPKIYLSNRRAPATRIW